MLQASDGTRGQYRLGEATASRRFEDSRIVHRRLRALGPARSANDRLGPAVTGRSVSASATTASHDMRDTLESTAHWSGHGFIDVGSKNTVVP